MTLTFFTDEELRCKCCGSLRLAPGFREGLNEIRLAFGEPMVITSACRCPKRNKAVGGKPGSMHLTTQPMGACAVDVSTKGWPATKTWRLAKLAMERGWSIGIAETFLHLDRRAAYPESGWLQPAMFTYG